LDISGFRQTCEQASDNWINIRLATSITTTATASSFWLLRSVYFWTGAWPNKAPAAGINVASILRRFLKHLPRATFLLW
jgi:hypothetical protein